MQKGKTRQNKTEKKNGHRAVISEVEIWQNKSLLWDSSWSSKQFYGNAREKVIKKAPTHIVLDPITGKKFKVKNLKPFNQKIDGQS